MTFVLHASLYSSLHIYGGIPLRGFVLCYLVIQTMVNTRVKVYRVIHFIMRSSVSTQQDNTQPLMKPPAKIQNPKPIRVHPKDVVGERVFTVNEVEQYRDCQCKIVFKYIVNDEVYKDIQGNLTKDLHREINGYTQWHFRTYTAVENEH